MKVRVKYLVENIVEVDDKFEKMETGYDDELSQELYDLLAEREIDLISGEQSILSIKDIYGMKL